MLSQLSGLSWTLHLGVLFFQQPFFTSPPLPHPLVTSLMDPHREKAMIDWAEARLCQTGVLKTHPKGFVYLKVDDAYITHLFSLLNPSPGIQKPPYFRKNNYPGAHISVFYKEELAQITHLDEREKSYSFKIKKLTFFPQKKNASIVLQVESPELEDLRAKYGLAPLQNAGGFHITLAKHVG